MFEEHDKQFNGEIVSIKKVFFADFDTKISMHKIKKC